MMVPAYKKKRAAHCLWQLLTILTTIILPLAGQAQQKAIAPQTPTDYTLMGAPLPPFVFMSYNDTAATGADKKAVPAKYKKGTYKTQTDPSGAYTCMRAKDFDNDATIFMMVFNPSCSHCEEVTFMLEKNIALFKKSKIVLVANKLMADYLPDYTQRHHIARYPAMYIGYDTAGYIDNTYLYEALPQINIYSAGRKLLKTYSGDVPMDTLKQYIDLRK